MWPSPARKTIDLKSTQTGWEYAYCLTSLQTVYVSQAVSIGYFFKRQRLGSHNKIQLHSIFLVLSTINSAQVSEYSFISSLATGNVLNMPDKRGIRPGGDGDSFSAHTQMQSDVRSERIK